MASRTLRQFSEAIEHLNFTSENVRIAELEAQAAELQAAAQRAQDRIAELTHAISHNARPDGRAVADALLSQVPAGQAASFGPNRDAMIAERESLTEARRDLRYREEGLRAQIDEIRADATRRAAEAAQPLIDEIMSQARAAVALMPELYASLEAIRRAVKAGGPDADRLREALRALQGSTGLLPRQKTHDVPAEITGALQPLLHKGSALKDVRLTDWVGLP